MLIFYFKLILYV